MGIVRASRSISARGACGGWRPLAHFPSWQPNLLRHTSWSLALSLSMTATGSPARCHDRARTMVQVALVGPTRRRLATIRDRLLYYSSFTRSVAVTEKLVPWYSIVRDAGKLASSLISSSVAFAREPMQQSRRRSAGQYGGQSHGEACINAERSAMWV